MYNINFTKNRLLNFQPNDQPKVPCRNVKLLEGFSPHQIKLMSSSFQIFKSKIENQNGKGKKVYFIR